MPTLTNTPTAAATATPTETPTLDVTATVAPTETPTMTPTPTPTVTATTTETPLPTATSKPSIATIQPLPELVLEPASGTAGTQFTLSGRFFAPRAQLLVYWNRADTLFGTVVTNDAGAIPPTVYAVPDGAAVGKHAVVIESEGLVVARASFSVTAP
jgi:hypothetical protein